jgi:hypothetical protein
MESTFRTLLEDYFSKGMSLDKVNEIIGDVYKPVNKTETKAETKAKPKKEKEANVSRFSKVMLTQLKSELIKAGLKFSEEKGDDELEKIKKECTKHLNSMDKETYLTKKIQDHISDFAKTKGNVDETKSNIGNTVVNHATVQVTLEELQKNTTLVVVGMDGPQHTFWDFEKQVFLTGPDSDSEDNDITVKKDGVTYFVGKTSGRVYKETDEGAEDEFVGYVGVGKFKDLLKK